MAANAKNALAVLLVFWLSDEPIAGVAAWAGLACAAAAWFAWRWARRRGRPVPEAVTEGTVRRVVRNAALMACVWAVPSLAFLPDAQPLPQAFLVVIAGGMVAGGVTCFYPIPRAAIVYAAILTFSALVGLIQISLPLLFGGVVIALSFFLVVRRVVERHADIFVSEIAARIELEEKNRRIEELMERTRRESHRISGESMRRLEQAQKMEALGQLTGGMAHDVNNILAVIRGNAELQQAAADKDPALLDEIVGATERGASLIQKLLAYARRQSLKPELTDVAAIAGDTVALLRRTLDARIRVETRWPADLWHATADKAQLEAALINLALNARDAMPEGGVVEVSCENRSVDAGAAGRMSEELGFEVPPGDYVRIAVRDSGVGMSAEVAGRAFEPFFTTKPVGAGTGLGLSMVLGFTRQSGGFAAIESAPGSGTTVSLHLPRGSRDGDAAATPGHSLDPGAGRVLLIEDDAVVRRTVAATLRLLGYAPVEAADAAEAQRLLEEGLSPALVLSDVVLTGGISGPQFARRLAEAGRPQRFLFMSGYPDLDGGAGALRPGDVLLRKPFSREALAEAVARAASG